MTLAAETLPKLALGTEPAYRMRAVPAANLSGDGWYIFAGPAEFAALIYAHVGRHRPTLMGRRNFRTGGVAFMISTDYAAAASDPRGCFRNPGA